MSGHPIEALHGTVAEWQAMLHPDERPDVLAAARQVLSGEIVQFDVQHRLQHRDGYWIWTPSRAQVVERAPNGQALIVAGSCTDITQVKEAERILRKTLAENERLVAELRDALQTVSSLSKLLPLCCNCKQFRDDDGHWYNLETYVAQHAKVSITHGICPSCVNELYPELDIPT